MAITNDNYNKRSPNNYTIKSYSDKHRGNCRRKQRGKNQPKTNKKYKEWRAMILQHVHNALNTKNNPFSIELHDPNNPVCLSLCSPRNMSRSAQLRTVRLEMAVSHHIRLSVDNEPTESLVLSTVPREGIFAPPLLNHLHRERRSLRIGGRSPTSKCIQFWGFHFRQKHILSLSR